MDDFHHGVRVIEVTGGARTIRAVATAVIGVVCTSNDADAATFPIDRPVVLTDVRRALAKAGKNGTLRPTLQAIADQCNTPTIVVRVPTGSDDAATTSAVIGPPPGRNSSRRVRRRKPDPCHARLCAPAGLHTMGRGRRPGLA